MKKFLKKGDGLATVVITIVLVAMVLLMVPAFKQFMKDNSTATGQMGSQLLQVTQPTTT